MDSTYTSQLLSFCNPLLKECTIFTLLSLLVDWAALHWTRLLTLTTKYHPFDGLRSIRRALLVYFGMHMARRTHPGAFFGGSTADLLCGHECELHFCSLDGSGVLSCGRGSGVGQVVKQESNRGRSTMNYCKNYLSLAARINIGVIPARGMAPFELTFRPVQASSPCLGLRWVSPLLLSKFVSSDCVTVYSQYYYFSTFFLRGSLLHLNVNSGKVNRPTSSGRLY